ncbi:MAG: DNA mismatch repair endonuclease MutL [Chloroflexi bacterium]|nr:DNA mismatch repair endonuclease MutL [Chloroflexota bacterium]
MPIKVLPAGLAARIAAGEVIERPASVVKELVENSLDAGATRISVEVIDGGRESIRVVDNGHGIPANEVPTAFERFATSKIDEKSDLTGIATLGFRGEALPSIASVSRVELTTAGQPAGQGVRAAVEFGGPVRVEPAGVPAGTAFTVRDLFRNTPARLKFLGSAATELARVHQVVATYALMRPDVAFSLAADGQARFSTPGRGDMLETVAGVYGWHVARLMVRVDPPGVSSPGHGEFAVSGLTGAPGLTRGNRAHITLSVNGRWIESRRLAFAVEQAYHGFLAERRFPVAVLRLTVPYGDVDVNVHPAKTEVRFLREQVVFAEVQKAVRTALVESAPVPHVQRPSPAAGSGPIPATSMPDNPLWPGQPDSLGVPTPGSIAAPTPRRSLPVLRVIGQAHDTYILAEGPGGVYLIDQHAAHERVLFEEVRDRLGKPGEGGQRLLAPEPVQLLPQHERVLRDHGALLSEAGFEVEPFGARMALVRAVPRVLPGGSGAEALVRLLDSLADGAGTGVWRERVLATLACHAAVRAGRRMTPAESQELLRRLEATEQPHTCPHGRPTMIYLSVSALERDFSRR